MKMVTEDYKEMATVCDLLDKMILNQLHLMEDKMKCELNIENNINNGSFHLAKSRYIMGQSSVSKERLPTECSSEFTASVTTDTVEDNDGKRLKLNEGNNDIKINPVHWFGVLVPQNLHKAKDIFRNAVNYIVECANIQLQIVENQNNIDLLKQYKKSVVNAN